MGSNSPTPSIPMQIRRIIFEKFNNIDKQFTNDEIFETMKQNGTIDESLIIDEVNGFFEQLCKEGLMRNIAQNFTTQWFKLFDLVEKIKCNSCNCEICLGMSEERKCPNNSCNATI